MITFWTNCSDDLFKSQVQTALSDIGSGISYRKISLKEDTIVYPEKDEIVVAMGATALKMLQKDGHLAKNKGLEKHRQTLIPYKILNKYEEEVIRGHWMVTYDPSVVEVDTKKGPELKWDILLAERVSRTGKVEPDLDNCVYEYVKDFSETIQYIKDKYEHTGKPIDVALDTETMGLHPWYEDKDIVCVQISVEPEQAQVYYSLGAKNIKKVIKQLDWILNTPKVRLRGANLKYDLIWLRVKWKLKCTNFTFDTLLGGSLINENRSNSLSNHSKEYTTIGGYDLPMEAKYDKAHMELIPKDDLLVYAAGDSDACLRTARVLTKKLAKQKRLKNFYQTILHPAARAFEEIEYHGIVVDREQFKVVEKEVRKAERQCYNDIVEMLPRRLKIKYGHKENMLTPALLREFLFTDAGLNLKPQMKTAKKGDPTISYDHLMMFLDNPKAKEFISKYKELNSAQKTLTTYVTGFLKHLRPDGRFHPTYALYAGGLYEGSGGDSGTVTGRTSAKNPAVQCLEGSMRVLTDKGWLPIKSIVEGFEKGEAFSVITHTGKVQPVVDSYRNGVKPVLTLSFEHGKYLTSTGNHPYLTPSGWVRADELKVGDICYALKRKWFRTQDPELHQSDLLQLDSDEEPMPKSDQQRLQELRRKGYKTVQTLAPVPELFGRYGGEARKGVVSGEVECERSLHTRELSVGKCQDPNAEPKKQQANNLQREDSDRRGVGERVRHKSRKTPLSFDRFGTIYGRSLDEGEVLQCGLFEECIVESVTEDGECETFDLTIQESHSFVAEGIVVHNTIPKHTKWAKLLRSCYVPPKGHIIFQVDFSEGELRIAACHANEPVMISTYKRGGSLHAMTASKLAGYDFDDYMGLKELDRELFDDFRFKAKAANFGLIYGMQAKGYREYARTGFDLELTIDEAHGQRDLFFETYPDLPFWHKRQVNEAHKHKQVTSPLGRVRHLPLIDSPHWKASSQAERQAINSPIQCTLSDMCIWSIAEIRKRFTTKEVWIAGMTHDSIYGYIPEDHYVERLREIKHIMENLPIKEKFGWDHQINFPVDVEVSDKSLADLEDLNV